MRLSVRTGRRLPTVLAGTVLGPDGRIALEARVAGTPIFVLRGDADRATLLLSRERRFVVAPARDILDALVGISIGPRELWQALSGCLAPGASVERAESFEDGRVVAVHLSGGDVAYLEHRGDTLTIRGADLSSVRVDYRWDGGGWPAQVVLRTPPDRDPALSIVARLEAVAVNPPVDRGVFVATLPGDATSMTLDELRASGPLGDDRGGH